MNIYVDADACPVKEIIVYEAKKYSYPVFMVCDTSHIFNDGYSTIITVDKCSDSADFYIINHVTNGDICVTQDYGLAAMLLARSVYAVHQNGFLYTSVNIDQLLFERHISKELRMIGKKGSRHKKRTTENNEHFSNFFSSLLKSLTEKSISNPS